MAPESQSLETEVAPKACDVCGRLGYTDYENELNQESARKGIRNGELERQRAQLLQVARLSYAAMGAAFNRIHCLPRSSDTALASRLEVTRAAIEECFQMLEEKL